MNKDNINKAAQIKQMFAPWINELIDARTRNCLRTEKATVSRIADGSKMGVKFAGEDTQILLPYVSSLFPLEVGDTVLVAYTYNDLRNAFVWRQCL